MLGSGAIAAGIPADKPAAPSAATFPGCAIPARGPGVNAAGRVGVTVVVGAIAADTACGRVTPGASPAEAVDAIDGATTVGVVNAAVVGAATAVVGAAVVPSPAVKPTIVSTIPPIARLHIHEEERLTRLPSES